MRQLIVGLVLIFSLLAHADCQEAYQLVSRKPALRNVIVKAAADKATGGEVVVLASGATVLSLLVGNDFMLMANTATIRTRAPQRRNDQSLHNFDNEIAAFRAAINNSSNDQLNRLFTSLAKKMHSSSLAPDQMVRVRELLAEGFQSERFCPVLSPSGEDNKNRAVFNWRALKDYLYNYI